MKRIQYARVRYTTTPVSGTSSCPSGSFDTSARLDTEAAMIRNATIPQVIVTDHRNPDSSGEAVRLPEITDQP